LFDAPRMVCGVIPSRDRLFQKSCIAEGGRVSVVGAEVPFTHARGSTAPLRAPTTIAASAPRTVRIGLLGYGRIGQAVASLAGVERERLLAAGLDVRIVGALVRDVAKPRGGPSLVLHATAPALFATRFDLLIDVMGGEHPAFELIQCALASGIHVVTANKTLMARRGLELHATALRSGAALCFDAAVLAGVPFLGAFARRPLVSAPRRIFGIVNGTSHFVAGALESGDTLPAAVARAVERGYAEPDSSADITGRDAAEKLTIVLHLAGFPGLTVGDLPTRGLDVITAGDIKAARAFGSVIKPIALASLDGSDPGAWVGPALLDRRHPFAALAGVSNAIEFVADDVDAITFAGPGAGPRETAGTILDDIVEAISLKGRAAARPWTARPVPADALRTPPSGEWYVRLSGASVTTRDLSTALVACDLTSGRVHASGGFAAAVVRTAKWTSISRLSQHLAGIGHDFLALPFIRNSYVGRG
jgi:homoserine dehydrogenase